MFEHEKISSLVHIEEKLCNFFPGKTYLCMVTYQKLKIREYNTGKSVHQQLGRLIFGLKIAGCLLNPSHGDPQKSPS